LAPTGPSGLEGRAIRGLIIEQHLACLREGLIPLAERCGRVMLEALYSLEVLCAAPSQSVERSQAAQISVVFEPRVFVIEQRSGGNPPGDKLTIRFAPRHLSACIEQFSAFETGINSFAVRDTDTLKNRRRLVISRLWRESLLDRAKTPFHPIDRRRYRPIPARRTGPTSASPDPRRIRAGTLAPTAETNYGRFELLPAPVQARAASMV
jgi:hypothetical protein